MSDDKEAETVAESQEKVETTEQEAKTVPLDAHIAERRRRQDAEQKAAWLEQQNLQLQSSFKKPAQQEEDDPYTKSLKDSWRKEIEEHTKSMLEKQYLQSNPGAWDKIQSELAPIINKKPWLAQSIQSAENRYARALEIIEDYTPKPVKSSEGEKRIQENQAKPGSPAGLTKTNSLSNKERLQSMNRKEFSQYRAELLGKRPNIR